MANTDEIRYFYLTEDGKVKNNIGGVITVGYKIDTIKNRMLLAASFCRKGESHVKYAAHMHIKNRLATMAVAIPCNKDEIFHRPIIITKIKEVLYSLVKSNAPFGGVKIPTWVRNFIKKEVKKGLIKESDLKIKLTIN